jgi:cell division transport system permease protein
VPERLDRGRSLTAVVAIMTFLASLTTGAVMMVVSAASDWQAEVGREVTIQVRPVAGRDIEADVRTAIEIARAAPASPMSGAYPRRNPRSWSSRGSAAGLALDDLPIPRMIVVKLASGATPDFAACADALAAQVPSASLDDHRGWIDRMRTMAGRRSWPASRSLASCSP